MTGTEVATREHAVADLNGRAWLELMAPALELARNVVGTPARWSASAYACPSSRSGSNSAVTTNAGATFANDGARSGEMRQSDG